MDVRLPTARNIKRRTFKVDVIQIIQYFFSEDKMIQNLLLILNEKIQQRNKQKNKVWAEKQIQDNPMQGTDVYAPFRRCQQSRAMPGKCKTPGFAGGYLYFPMYSFLFEINLYRGSNFVIFIRFYLVNPRHTRDGSIICLRFFSVESQSVVIVFSSLWI